jgi:hypothetical protein
MAKINRGDLRREVSQIILDHSTWGRGRIYDELCNRFGEDEVRNLIRERSVGNWIREIRNKPDDSLWKPWITDIKSEVRPSFLFTLQTIVSVIMDRGLLEREAQWAARLEIDLYALDPIAQYFVISEYSNRQAIGELEGKEIETGDLDTLLVLKPWTDDGKERYAQALDMDALVPPRIRMMMVPHENPSGADVFFSWRGCIQLGVPFQLMQESARNFPPVVSGINEPPTDKEDHLLNDHWFDVLMEYWRSVRESEKKSEGVTDEQA